MSNEESNNNHLETQRKKNKKESEEVERKRKQGSSSLNWKMYENESESESDVDGGVVDDPIHNSRHVQNIVNDELNQERSSSTEGQVEDEKINVPSNGKGKERKTNEPSSQSRSSTTSNPQSPQSSSSSSDSKIGSSSVSTSYCHQLSQWVTQCQYYNYISFMNSLMMMNMNYSQQQQAAFSAGTTGAGNQFAFQAPFFPINAGVNIGFAGVNQGQPRVWTRINNVNQMSTNGTNLGRLYAIPRLWKRIVAEIFDFILLLMLKLMVTYFAVDYLELIDLDKFDLDRFNLNLDKFDLDNFGLETLLDSDFDALALAYELTSEILIIEMIHRLIVIAYETICLHASSGVRIGGQTPGKAMMGLSVVSCERILELALLNEQGMVNARTNTRIVRVIPANNLGMTKSFMRALIKNLSAIFFIPASLTVFFSRHNRPAYDIVCKSIVVEDISASHLVRLHLQQHHNQRNNNNNNNNN